MGKEAEEGAPQREDALAAVEARRGLVQQVGRQQGSEQDLQFVEGLGANCGDGAFDGGQPGAPLGEDRGVEPHIGQYIYCLKA